MNRRGFIMSILAAPLAAMGSFAGNHNLTWVASDIHAGVNVTGMWTNLFPESNWTYVEFAGGKILRKEHWDKLPFTRVGDLCGSACDKGNFVVEQ